ncbi:MAG: pentapeptide repeat-containing protein [Lentisphaeria bacterium]|nr:pentapeptide repeat-containing protein [Lentisphaeria bacterium]
METISNENAARIRMTPGEFIRQTEIVNCGNLRNNEDNFQNVEIDGFTVENKNLIRTEFHYAKLSNATFSGVNLEGADFQFSELRNVTFLRCTFKRGGFNFAKMDNVRFQECLLDSSSFSFASGDSTFENCSMTGAEFHRTALRIVMNTCDGQAAQFNSCADLNIQAENCDFLQTEFNDGTFFGTMTKCVFANTDFSGSDCRSLKLVNCRIRSINTDGSCGIDVDSSVGDDEDDFPFA